MSQPAAQTRAAGSEELKKPIEAIAVRSECSSSRILAYVRSSSLTSTRSGRGCPISSGTVVEGPDTSVSMAAVRVRPSSVSE
jgi:hypothetical protein